jgi:outer membrane protein
MRQLFQVHTAALASLLAAGTASAQAPAASKPLWELGGVALGVSQQAYPGSDQQVNRALALPFFLYRGPFLRADGETLGVRAVKTPTVEVDLGVAASLGSSSRQLDARRGMPTLGTLVEVGPRVKWQLGDGPAGAKWQANFPLRAVFDLSDSLSQRGLAFEPELVLSRNTSNGWSWSARGGLVAGNRKLNDTFYGVAPVFATAARPAYEAKSGLIAWRLGASASRPITPDWSFFTFARVDTVAGAANDNSPLVRQKTGTSVGLGVSYTWLRSERRAAD